MVNANYIMMKMHLEAIRSLFCRTHSSNAKHLFYMVLRLMMQELRLKYLLDIPLSVVECVPNILLP